MRLPVTVVHRHGCLKSVPALEPRVLRPTGGHSHVRGFVCGCARSSINFPDCIPKRSTAEPPSFQVPAPVPADPAQTLTCAQWLFLLFLPGLRWYRLDAQGNLSYSKALHFQRRACRPPRRSFLSHLTCDEGPRRGEVPGGRRAHRTPLCHRYHCSRETLEFGSCDWEMGILVAS